jgi:hemoglobin
MRRLIPVAVALTCVSTHVLAQPAKHKSLYQRLGGQTAIVAVVDDFVANVAADEKINGFFSNADIPRLKAKLVEQLCAGTGGPCKYTGKDMKSVHAGRGIGSKEFDALVADLGKSLTKFKVPAKEQRELVAILAPMKADIVENP